jgi:hypothetical protein
LERGSLQVFIAPPAGSILAKAAEYFAKEDHSGLSYLTDPARIRAAVLEKLKGDGMPVDASGPWLDRLVDTQVELVRQKLITMSSLAPADPTVDYRIAGFALAAIEHCRSAAPNAPLEDVLYEAAVEIGPGVSLDDMKVLLGWQEARRAHLTPQMKYAHWWAVRTAGQAHSCDRRMNLVVTVDEYERRVGGVLDELRGG